MKFLKRTFPLLFLTVIMASFSQCSSAQKLESKSPIVITEAYCQEWIGGVEGGGSGLNIFIKAEDVSVILDSVYFRGKAAILETKPQDESLYIGRFMSEFNQKKDVVFSKDSNEEYGNEMPEVKKELHFKLEDNECVVSYKDNGKTKYFKIENVKEKEMIPYPSAPVNKQ